MPKKALQREATLRPRLRVLLRGQIALGPGRVDLLEFIAETQSLRAAAERMGMSYMRAWKMVKSLNAWFRPALVDLTRGGKRGGGAKLTETGRKVIALYRGMEVQSQRAVNETWKQLQTFLAR